MARNLHDRGVPVTLLTNMKWVQRTRWAEGYLLPQPHRARDAWLQRLEELAQRGPGVLISGSDVATDFLVKERHRIPAELRSFESNDSAHMRLMDKGSLYEAAERAGVRYPRTLSLNSGSDLEAVSGMATFPCLVKPAMSHLWRGLFGERRVLVVNGPEDLKRVAGPALDAGLELLVTEHVPGPDRNLEGALTIRSADGSYPLAYGRRKVRMYPPGYGAASIIESAPEPEAMELATRLLDAAGLVGISSVEVKRHAETGERMLIEVNVRVPRWWGLGDAAGTEASWRLYATLAGIPLGSQPRQRSGVRTIVPALELRAALVHLRERRLTLRKLLEGYRGVRDVSGLSWRDPKPILLVLADFFGWLWRYLRRRARST